MRYKSKLFLAPNLQKIPRTDRVHDENVAVLIAEPFDFIITFSIVNLQSYPFSYCCAVLGD